MNAVDVVRALRQCWPIAVLLLLAPMVIALVAAFATPATYQATTVLRVQPVPATDGASVATDPILKSRAKSTVESAFATSVLTSVRTGLQLAESEADLRRRLTATWVTDSPTVVLSARASDPAQAAGLAKAWATALISEVTAQNQVANPAVAMLTSQEATAPTGPIWPLPAFNAMLGVGLGVLLSFGFLVFQALRVVPSNDAEPAARRIAA